MFSFFYTLTFLIVVIDMDVLTTQNIVWSLRICLRGVVGRYVYYALPVINKFFYHIQHESTVRLVHGDHCPGFRSLSWNILLKVECWQILWKLKSLKTKCQFSFIFIWFITFLLLGPSQHAFWSEETIQESSEN